MLKKILTYPKGAKPRQRAVHYTIISEYGVRFGITSNIELLWFYALIYSSNGKSLIPQSSKIRITENEFKRLYPTIGFTTNQRRLSTIIYNGTRGNYLCMDGWNYRPKGFLRLSGRNAYSLIDKECKKILGYSFMMENSPNSLLIPSLSLIGALAFWSANCRGLKSFNEVVYELDRDLFSAKDRQKVLDTLIQLTI